MKRKEESGELRKVAVGLRREKNLEKNGEEKNLGGSEGHGRRKRKWVGWMGEGRKKEERGERKERK